MREGALHEFECQRRTRERVTHGERAVHGSVYGEAGQGRLGYERVRAHVPLSEQQENKGLERIVALNNLRVELHRAHQASQTKKHRGHHLPHHFSTMQLFVAGNIQGCQHKPLKHFDLCPATMPADLLICWQQ
eukprot:1157480-Pelagomonas_calceolata.AAC.3